MNWWTGVSRVKGKLNAESPLGRLCDGCIGLLFAIAALSWYAQGDVFTAIWFAIPAPLWWTLACWPPVKKVV